MYEKRRRRKKKRKDFMKISKLISVGILLLALLASIGYGIYYFVTKEKIPSPEETLQTYIECLQQGDYQGMYALLNDDSKAVIREEELIQRYENIYDGIEAVNIKVMIETEFSKEEQKNLKKKKPVVMNYSISMDTIAGPLTIPSSTILTFKEEENAYRMVWDIKEIFPGLKQELKVKVKSVYGERGNIYDTFQNPIAHKGEAWAVGIVPGKMEEPREASIVKIAEAMDLSVEKIEKALSAKWVKDDLFVPLRTISKNNIELKEMLLELPGVLLSTTEKRVYPEGISMGHLAGYVQPITAEELTDSKGKRYNTQSIIGKSGIEYAYEDILRSQDGYRIVLTDEDGNEVSEVLSSEMNNGKDLRLTIINSLQKSIYEQLVGDNGFCVVMNPKTGDILSLVSTPAYDSNEFAFGFTANAWNTLNEDTNLPLYNRIKGTWCPGSSLKPIIAAMGITTKTLDPNEDIKNEGLAWQKDASWGNYKITTLQDYPVKNLQNALIYSDNIYFAKVALAIGKDTFQEELKKLGFHEKLPFALNYTPSSYGNDETIADEIQLADSGYGQGQMLVSPLHLACMYSAFYNGGNMVTPNLVYGETNGFWKENVFSKEACDKVLADMIQIVENPNGTASECKIEGKTIAGKTGTAELKVSKEDTLGKELGWFVAMTPEETENPLLVVMMIEDVKGRGGSHYVVPKVKSIIEQYYQYR